MLKYKFNNKCIARLFSVLLMIAILATFLVAFPTSAEGATSGSCGTSLTWSYDCGTLTISGSGFMTDFRETDMAPWYHLREGITRVVLPEDLNGIGNLAFYGCSNLKTVIMPSKVRRIGEYAFAGCTLLACVELGVTLREIGKSAFYGCEKLDAVRLPSSLEIIGAKAFYLCESLTSITVPRSVTKMGSSVFAYCSNLVKAEINASLTSLPDWTFYGCGRLLTVALSPSVGTIESYAFKKCDSLSTIYFSGPDDNMEVLREEILEYVPTFETNGMILSGLPSSTVVSGTQIQNEDGTVTTENKTIHQDDKITVVSTVSNTHSAETQSGGQYSANISLTVESQEHWSSAKAAIKEYLKAIGDEIAKSNASSDTVTVDVYLKDGGAVDQSFLEEMSGRDVDMTVTSSNGSSWKIDCENLDGSNLSGNHDYSHTVQSSTQESKDTLKTDNCYGLTFNESAKVNAEIVIQLPSAATPFSNAFLYQIEEDGTHTRIQAVAIDKDNKAHFYLGAVDKDTPYVIGVNVPGENTDDVIIPDSMRGQHGNAVERLQKIDYAITGRTSSWGLTFGQVMLILLAVLALCIVVVGVAMFIMNKRRLQKQYAEMYTSAAGRLSAQVDGKKQIKNPVKNVKQTNAKKQNNVSKKDKTK